MLTVALGRRPDNAKAVTELEKYKKNNRNWGNLSVL
jgi:hypothetical protein